MLNDAYDPSGWQMKTFEVFHVSPQTPHFGAFLFVLYATGPDFCRRFILP